MAAMPFDVLRTKAAHQARSNGWKSLGIASSTPGCGKSMIGPDLALILPAGAAPAADPAGRGRR